jgi:transcription elongation factor Elf1
MNYQVLKNIVDRLLQNFACPSCSELISEQDVEIVWAAGNTININVLCPSCNKNAMIRTELAQVNLWKINVDSMPSEIQWKINTLKSELSINEHKSQWPQVKDEEIIDLNKKLKNISWVDELFTDS